MREDEAARGLDEKLRQCRGEVLDTWREAILSSYAPQTARLLAGAADAFRNPIRHRIDRTTEAVVDALADEGAAGTLGAALDPMIRVQAVQDCRPSQALAFVFQLRAAVCRVLGSRLSPAERARLDGRLDEVVMAAFDVYAGCRQELEQIRVREARRRVAALLSQAAGPGPREQRDPAAGPAGPADLKELA